MGIRFQCHQCKHTMNVKDHLAGKKSRCPECETRFRIPSEGESESIPIVDGSEDPSNKSPFRNPPAPVTPTANVAAQSVASTATLTQNVPSQSTSASTSPQQSAWMVRPPSGGQYGPATQEMLVDWIRERRVTSDSLVWKEGWKEWLAANAAFPELFPPPAPSTPPAPIPPAAVPLPPAAPSVPPSPSIPLSSPAVAANLDSAKAPSNGANEALSAVQTKAMMRMRKKKRRQLQAVGILSVLAILLIFVLIVVLIWNPAVTTPPGAK